MIRRMARATMGAVLAVGILAASVPAVASAAAPAWRFAMTSQPTHFTPGSSGNDTYLIVATNVGASSTSGTITVTDTLPAGLNLVSADAATNDPGSAKPTCTALVQTVTCTALDPIHSSLSLWVEIQLDVESLPDGSTRTDQAEISGGAAPSVQATTTTTISALDPPFGFLAGEVGFGAPFNGPDGSPVTQAGSHPDEFNVSEGFPTVKPGGSLTSAGHVRDITVDLPRGLLGNPAATPVRCTEDELITEDFPGCPAASQVGTVTATVLGVGVRPETSPLYSMVPPPGAPASFAFDAAGIGIFVHAIASVRSDGDYGVSGSSKDILALGLNPILDARIELWGDPSGHSHDYARGPCLVSSTGPCPGAKQQTAAFLTLPVDCPGQPTTFLARADSWEEPGLFREASYSSADLAGTPAATSGCNQLDFKPTIEARPTTSLADSPSGLDVNLHQPQEPRLDGLSTAIVKDTTVTLPEGMAVNASQANGLQACTSAEIGLTTPVGQVPIHFSKSPAGCPDASKLGTVDVTTPLLAQFDDENKAMRDPEGNAIPEPLHGTVYIAKPFDNPFGSLIAIYLTIEDPKSGTIAKLAGIVEPDPVTGQLRTRVSENPELPLEDVHVHLFGGARGGLQTPLTCGTHTSTADLTPWSAPQTPDVHRADSFAITGTPGGGACPSSTGQAPNAPAFSAGTISPRAGAYSPFILKLTREDGSQRLASLDTTLPPGLTAKLAGVPYCSEAQIAAAQARNQPNQGAAEQASPSCPTASEVGTVRAGAGAGPTPFYVQGHIYLAGPYKGAPVSLVAISPAVAGPFDLGAVVVRAAVYLDPVTGQGHVVSDPFPSILDGIPLDLRSVAVEISHPRFTLNPTSCDLMAVSGTATSTLGQVAPLSNPFQVTGCNSLPYKPKLHLRLSGPTHRGGHPRFRAVFEAKPGEANTARAVLTLPHSEFIDQAHFRTICTRVQYAANQCPAGSVYGHVKAISPLLDYPLEGPIYLRSSSHELPDVVAALRGPPSQPIALDLVGRVDSLNGGLRTTIETVPDAPVTKAIITLQGAKKGLFQNSTNICKGTFRAALRLTGQNGKALSANPAVKADCPKASRKPGKGKRRH